MVEAKRRVQADEKYRAAVDSASVLNPVIGLSTEDLLKTARDLLTRSLRQPTVGLEQGARLWQEWMKIFFSQSELAPDPRDRRF